MATLKPQILCIDDDEGVLAGLKLSLRNVGEVHTATSGYAGLELAESLPDLAVVICDMRMPGITGDIVLGQMHRRFPDVTRVLLTGFSDTPAAIRAINEGRIFRFLNKPCGREEMIETIGDAIAQYRLVTSEKQLLEQTVKGCIEALSDALAMASPATYGQAKRTCELLAQVARECHFEASWSMEMAITLGNLALVELPADVQERLLIGARLNPEQQKRVQAAKMRSFTILQKIPRIEPVLDLLIALDPSLSKEYFLNVDQRTKLSSQVEAIRFVQRFVQLESSAVPYTRALQELLAEMPQARPFVDALDKNRDQNLNPNTTVELPLSAIKEGMVLAQPIYTLHGLLLTPAGYVVNESFPDRLREYAPHLIGQKIAVILPSGRA